MRKLIARVFDYSLDGVLATEGTEFFQFCRDLPDDPAEVVRGSEFYAGADLHIMGRPYQSMATTSTPPTIPTPPPHPLLQGGVLSHAHRRRLGLSTTVASGDLAQEIDGLAGV